MSRQSAGRNGGLLIGVACLLALAVACSSKTPTAPVQTPAPVVGLVAQFSCSSTGLTVSFFDRSIGNPTSYSWNFGDGGTSTLQNPVHTYGSAGDRQVRLTVSKAGLSPASATNLLSALDCEPTSAGGGGP